MSPPFFIGTQGGGHNLKQLGYSPLGGGTNQLGPIQHIEKIIFGARAPNRICLNYRDTFKYEVSGPNRFICELWELSKKVGGHNWRTTLTLPLNFSIQKTGHELARHALQGVDVVGLHPHKT
jgi:hypothetical protein